MAVILHLSKLIIERLLLLLHDVVVHGKGVVYHLQCRAPTTYCTWSCLSAQESRPRSATLYRRNVAELWDGDAGAWTGVAIQWI